MSDFHIHDHAHKRTYELDQPPKLRRSLWRDLVEFFKALFGIQ